MRRVFYRRSTPPPSKNKTSRSSPKRFSRKGLIEAPFFFLSVVPKEEGITSETGRSWNWKKLVYANWIPVARACFLIHPPSAHKSERDCTSERKWLPRPVASGITMLHTDEHVAPLPATGEITTFLCPRTYDCTYATLPPPPLEMSRRDFYVPYAFIYDYARCWHTHKCFALMSALSETSLTGFSLAKIEEEPKYEEEVNAPHISIPIFISLSLGARGVGGEGGPTRRVHTTRLSLSTYCLTT